MRYKLLSQNAAKTDPKTPIDSKSTKRYMTLTSVFQIRRGQAIYLQQKCLKKNTKKRCYKKI